MLEWYKKFLDATDPTSSLKHLAYAATIAFSIVWLTWDLAKHGMSVNWIAAYTILVSAVTTTKIVGGNDGSARDVPKP